MDGYDSDVVTVIVVQTHPFVHTATGSESSSAVHHFISPATVVYSTHRQCEIWGHSRFGSTNYYT